jgi:hypothetical protein
LLCVFPTYKIIYRQKSVSSNAAFPFPSSQRRALRVTQFSDALLFLFDVPLSEVAQATSKCRSRLRRSGHRHPFDKVQRSTTSQFDCTERTIATVTVARLVSIHLPWQRKIGLQYNPKSTTGMRPSPHCIRTRNPW